MAWARTALPQVGTQLKSTASSATQAVRSWGDDISQRLSTINWADDTGAISGASKADDAANSAAKAADDAPIVWPPNNGFDGAPRVTVLKPGTQVDRFGFDGGRFVAPNGTPVGQRSLAPGTSEKPYRVFEVTNRLVVQEGPAAPWFGHPGGGLQYRLPASVDDLLSAGYIRRIG